MRIFIHQGGRQFGPFTEEEVRVKLAAGIFSLQDYVWWEGQLGWMQLGHSPLAAVLAPSAPGSGPAAPTSGYAVGSLIAGIVTLLFGCPGLLCGPLVFGSFVPAILAVVLGHLALSELKRNTALKGRAMAVTGTILGYVSLVLGLICFVLILIFVGLNLNNSNLIDQIRQKIQPAQGSAGPATETPADETTNSPGPTPTNTDQSTNDAAAMTNAPDSGTNAPDNSTNAGPVILPPGSATNDAAGTNGADPTNAPGPIKP